MIKAEGVESLSEEELRQACRDRGLLGLLSVDEMRQQVLFISIFVLIYFLVISGVLNEQFIGCMGPLKIYAWCKLPELPSCFKFT